jgi:hypothetical protein
MNKVQMDEYLVSIGGLENGFYSDRPPIKNANFFDVDEGWYELIKDLIDDLIKLGWNKQVCQVKEKFGGVRFYINEGSDEIFKRIGNAENDSYKICEKCGEQGQFRNDIGWYLTLCDEHYKEKKSNYEKRKI